MDINDERYLEDFYIMRCANADGYEKLEFSELTDIKSLTAENIENCFGEYEIRNELRGSIIYKCTPVCIIQSETILKQIK